jgi:Glycosyl hydrolase family 26
MKKRQLGLVVKPWQRSNTRSVYGLLPLAMIVLVVAALGVRFLWPSSAATNGAWSSGSSEYGSAQGFGSWRGETSTIYGCWNDHDGDQGNPASCMDAQKAGGYKYDIELASGFLAPGDSMSGAAGGAYEGRWRSYVQGVASRWGTARTVYIRPAHEFNLGNYRWQINNTTDADNFKAAWRRYYNIIKTELKDKGYNAKMTLSYNWDSHMNGVTIDQVWPGNEYVDVIGIDRYDAYWGGSSPPTCHNTDARWNEMMNYNNRAGNLSLTGWQQFAREKGKPIAFPEWGLADKATSINCDNPLWIQNMHDFFSKNAGTGPAQVEYEVYFNYAGYGGWTQLYPSTNSPNAAAKYKSLVWGSGGAVNPTPTPTPPTPTPPTPTPPTPPATKSPDLNGDGKVSLVDLSMLLAGWGKSGATDLDGNGTTALPDLSRLLSAWSP